MNLVIEGDSFDRASDELENIIAQLEAGNKAESTSNTYMDPLAMFMCRKVAEAHHKIAGEKPDYIAALKIMDDVRSVFKKNTAPEYVIAELEEHVNHFQEGYFAYLRASTHRETIKMRRPWTTYETDTGSK